MAGEELTIGRAHFVQLERSRPGTGGSPSQDRRLLRRVERLDEIPQRHTHLRVPLGGQLARAVLLFGQDLAGMIERPRLLRRESRHESALNPGQSCPVAAHGPQTR